MKTVGESSVDADAGTLVKTADDGSKTNTGFRHDVEHEDAGLVKTGTASAVGSKYEQAVEARDLAIGKTLDTSDDKARPDGDPQPCRLQGV